MLSWALRYLVMAVGVAIGFAVVQGGEWLEPARDERSEARRAAGEHGRSVRAERPGRSVSARERTADRSGAPADDWSDDDWAADDGWATADDWSGNDGWDDQDGVEPEDGTDGFLELVIPAGPRGHFVVDAEVEGTPLTFLIDTGATDVVLSREDARRLGLEPRTLDYSRAYRTANGIVRAAPVTLRELRVGELRLYDLDASVNESPLPMSLLGMSFLGRLESYEVANGRLVLRW